MSACNHSILLVSSRPWNDDLPERLSKRLGCNFHHIRSQSEFTLDAVASLEPEWIIVPHWNHLIPEKIWSRWPTVIFHMTDLPYGRGGSPLQNLIKRGHFTTMLSALRCCSGLDSGDVYMKEPLSLSGSAEEIFLRADALMELMIERLIREKPIPQPQVGEPVFFKRRKPMQSNLAECPAGNLAAWQDHIRMMDADGYPHAFIDSHGMRLEFRRVCRRSDGLHADVRISPSDP